MQSILLDEIFLTSCSSCFREPFFILFISLKHFCFRRVKSQMGFCLIMIPSQRNHFLLPCCSRPFLYHIPICSCCLSHGILHKVYTLDADSGFVVKEFLDVDLLAVRSFEENVRINDNTTPQSFLVQQTTQIQSEISDLGTTWATMAPNL